MVDVEALDALDLVIWLGRGADAARRLGCNQSTVSRRSGQCLEVFDLRLLRDADGHCCTAHHPLLHLQREVHQLHRLRLGRGLRIDASLLAAPLLHPRLEPSWISGHGDGLGWQRPIHLLEERILDAWVTGMAQELPDQGLEAFCRIPLLQTPLLMAAEPQHPLVGQGALQLRDLEGMPRLAPRRGWYPRTEQQLGDWRQRTPALLLDQPARRQGLTAPRGPGGTRVPPLQYGTAFSLAQQAVLQPLPLALGVQTELSLVMRCDVRDTLPMEQLTQALQRRALQAALADQGTAGFN